MFANNFKNLVCIVLEIYSCDNSRIKGDDAYPCEVLHIAGVPTRKLHNVCMRLCITSRVKQRRWCGMPSRVADL